MQAAAVHELAGRAVGFGGVKADVASEAGDAGDVVGKFGDGHVRPVAHVDVAEHGLGVLRVAGLGQVHHVHAGGGHVVDKQELTHGRAAAPDGDLGRARQLGCVKPADQRWDDVAVFRVVVVARAIEVGGHDAAVVHAVAGAKLAVVAFAELDAGDLGHGVGLVGGFERAGEQRALIHGLRGEPGVDAAGAEEEQLLHAVPKGGVDHVGFHHQVLVDEVGGVGVVGVDAADLGRGQIHLLRFDLREEGAHGGLVGQVEFGVGAGDDGAGGVAGGEQLAHDGRADHAAVACDVDGFSAVHAWEVVREWVGVASASTFLSEHNANGAQHDHEVVPE
ncbi:hypothetical protein FQZ97_731150 [compost metagenome]